MCLATSVASFFFSSTVRKPSLHFQLFGPLLWGHVEMFSTISQDYENRQVIFIITSLFLLIGIVRLRQVGGHPRVSVRFLPAEVRAHWADHECPSGSLPEVHPLQGSARQPLHPFPVLNVFNCLRQYPPNQIAASQVSLLQKGFPTPPLPPEIGRVPFPIAFWFGPPVACYKRHLPSLRRSKIHARRPIASSRRRNTFVSDDQSLYVPWWSFPLPAVCDSKLI